MQFGEGLRGFDYVPVTGTAPPPQKECHIRTLSLPLPNRRCPHQSRPATHASNATGHARVIAGVACRFRRHGTVPRRLSRVASRRRRVGPARHFAPGRQGLWPRTAPGRGLFAPLPQRPARRQPERGRPALPLTVVPRRLFVRSNNSGRRGMQQEGSAVKRIAPNLADCAAEQGSPSKENMPPGLLNTAGTRCPRRR